MDKKTEKQIEERRAYVEKLALVMGISAGTVAELLRCSRQTVLQDMKVIKERWIERGAVVSDNALTAHEEIEALRSLASDMMAESSNTDGAQKALFADIAAKCLFLAGRLKQGRNE